MTIEPICYVCGKVQPCIDGLCPECHMNEFRSPGAAFAATFGSIPLPAEQPPPDYEYPSPREPGVIYPDDEDYDPYGDA